MAEGKESSLSLTNFEDIDEEDKAGRKTRLFKRNETQGYIDTASLDAASVDKVQGLNEIFGPGPKGATADILVETTYSS